MGESADAWADGQLAWARLAGWFRGMRAAPGDDDRALAALTDLGLVRRLLDHTEFEAVRAARREGRSWSEIAVRLGVTRQSAWEKWRDIDDAGPGTRHSVTPLAPELMDQVMTGLKARASARRSVMVPSLVGLSWTDAGTLLRNVGLVGIAAEPEALPSEHDTVTGQAPESGATVPRGSRVTLWLDRGDGGSGVREPRRPMPDLKTGRKMLDEITDEAV